MTGLGYQISPGTALAPGELVTIRVRCDTGRVPLSGGVGTYGSPRDLRLLASAPTETRDGWLVTVANHSPRASPSTPG